ncbi:acetyl-CoA carboxylase biotin carboxyl carrier protein [Streptococcus zalophi]|nr:acetyl-CoA carboxylase biotin carboxyl carrier protein [Streptococcus zalophi]MCR8967888.1 acetyl-CoA carboxylase biotin carboxyl carrier protein [Streptococcus zalophi]
MNISEIKELMTQFDQSSLREFSYKTNDKELVFSKNDRKVEEKPSHESENMVTTPVVDNGDVTSELSKVEEIKQEKEVERKDMGDVIESPLVGVAYLSPSPTQEPFVAIGDSVKKGQTLLIIEAMKVMNEILAPRDGIITDILVSNEEVVEFGKGLVSIK